MTENYHTTRFAIDYDCYIAINGEAGESMTPGCDLGEWTGNWIVRGNAVLLEYSDGYERVVYSHFGISLGEN